MQPKLHRVAVPARFARSKSLYVRVKENLKKRGVLFDGNNIDLGKDVDEAELIEEMNQINDVKYDMLPEN